MTDSWSVSRERSLDGYTVEWAEPAELLVSRRNQLYRVLPGARPQRLLSAPAPAWKRLISPVRLASRFLRFSYYNVLKLNERTLLLNFAKSMGIFRDGEYRPLAGFVRPSRALRAGCALDTDGSVFFGEYILNDDRACDIHVYRLAPGAASVEVIRRFDPGVIRHIHGIYRDPYDGSLWMTSGDIGAESRIMRTTDHFKTADIVGMGDESWRCVSLRFTPEAIYYATDAEFQQNHIHRISRATGQRETVTPIEGPVYYSHAVGSDLFFAVSAELCPSQTGRSSVLWNIDPYGNARRLTAFPKDAWPVRLCLPGALYFPQGPGLPDEFYMFGVALRGADNRTFRVRRSEAGA